MKNIIIGTAGHIDHGKTALIQALTGTNTDSLKEEKQRGITIDIGFTYFDLPNGEKAGIVDVPGHEKFIKNMLAGVSGMDLVMLVIAADEGIMPQTKEHLDILSILRVKKGIVVLTKSDIVDDDWLEMVTEEVKEGVKGTFLEESPIVPVSSKTGDGLDLLKKEIQNQTEVIEEKKNDIPTRIPVDRVFTVDGFGTVVTGTQIEGVLKLGDEVKIYPNNIESKIRNIQVHGKDAKESYAGQRVAINLQNVKKDQISRGDVIAQKESMTETMMIDGKLELLKETNRVIENRTRVRLYHGTREVLGRVVLLDKEELRAGESGYVQYRLEENIAVKQGDYYVVRFYSPMETIGGGIVLDGQPKKHKRYKEDVLKDLKTLETGTQKDFVAMAIKKYSQNFETTKTISMKTGIKVDIFNQWTKQLEEDEEAVRLSEQVVVHQTKIEQLKKTSNEILNTYHEKYPYKNGMSKEEFRNKLLGDKSRLGDIIIGYMAEKEEIEDLGSQVKKRAHKPYYTKEQQKIYDEIKKHYEEAKYQVKQMTDIVSEFKNKEEATEIFQSIVENGEIVKIDGAIYLTKENYEKAKEAVKKYIKENGSITLGQFRDLVDTTRKYAVPILEKMDQDKITIKKEDERFLVEK